jgi:hypothetical protein
MNRSIGLYTLLLLALLLSCASCSYTCKYEIRGTVVSAVDATPLKQVSVTVDVSQHSVPVLTTDADGRFAISIEIPPTSVDQSGAWTLTLGADGYRTEEFSIGPVNEPRSPKDKVYIFVYAQLQPVRNP